MATMSQITQRVLVQIRDLSGVDVQKYTQPVIYEKIQSVFNTEFTARWWDRFMDTNTYTLDGTTGQVTTDLSSLIKDAGDLRYVWLQGKRNPLPVARRSVPIELITQPCIQQTKIAAKGFFRVIPLTTSGTVRLLYRTKPNNFSANDEVPFDEEFMVQAVAAEMTMDDGLNQVAAKRFVKKADDLRKRLVSSDAEMEESYYSPTSSGLTEWSTR